MDELVKSIGANGPWALAAGFLLQQVIKAWSADRAQLNELLTEFRKSLDGLTSAMEALKEEILMMTEKGGKA